MTRLGWLGCGFCFRPFPASTIASGWLPWWGWARAIEAGLWTGAPVPGRCLQPAHNPAPSHLVALAGWSPCMWLVGICGGLPVSAFGGSGFGDGWGWSPLFGLVGVSWWVAVFCFRPFPVSTIASGWLPWWGWVRAIEAGLWTGASVSGRCLQPAHNPAPSHLVALAGQSPLFGPVGVSGGLRFLCFRPFPVSTIALGGRVGWAGRGRSTPGCGQVLRFPGWCLAAAHNPPPRPCGRRGGVVAFRTVVGPLRRV
jgi:hypothetical protein